MTYTTHEEALQKRIEELEEALTSMVYQFGYTGPRNGRHVIGTGGLSALEEAFGVLGWSDPKPFPEGACNEDGCHKTATCGTSTKDGTYKRLCGDHATEARRALEGK